MQPSGALPAELEDITSDPAHRATLLKVLSVVADMTGDQDRAVFLVKNEPLRVFDDQTAAALVAKGQGKDVLNYLESMSTGASG